MEKKVLLTISMLFVLLCSYGCSGTPTEPREIADYIVKAYSKGDQASIEKFYGTSMNASSIKDMEDEYKERLKGAKFVWRQSFDTSEETISILYNTTLADGKEGLFGVMLIKEDGKWLYHKYDQTHLFYY